jgi:pimeloyl-ACP methyl ester carboxylesterase
MSAASHTLELPGVRLHFEVRGSGPALVITAAPMGAAPFQPLAEALADRFTVVTHDPRGISASVLDDPDQDSTPELRADDLVAILDELGIETADVFGSSGGAVTGLALMARHPARVRTLIAHEPPLIELLPDADARQGEVYDIVETFHRDGLGAAMGKFMAMVGGGDAGSPAAGAADRPAPRQEDLDNAAHFVGHELAGTTSFVPDAAAIAAAPGRVIVAIGDESSELMTFRTSSALADLLGVTPVRFPGDHAGFLGHTAEFADAIVAALATDGAVERPPATRSAS